MGLQSWQDPCIFADLVAYFPSSLPTPQTSTSPPHKSQQNNKGKKNRDPQLGKIPTWAGCWQSQCKFYLSVLHWPLQIHLTSYKEVWRGYYWHQHWGPSRVYLQSTSVYKEPSITLGWRHQFSSTTEGPPGILAGSVESHESFKNSLSSHLTFSHPVASQASVSLVARSYFHSQRSWCQGLQ